MMLEVLFVVLAMALMATVALVPFYLSYRIRDRRLRLREMEAHDRIIEGDRGRSFLGRR